MGQVAQFTVHPGDDHRPVVGEQLGRRRSGRQFTFGTGDGHGELG